MHCPGELMHAAGALPFVLQEADDPITVGHGMLPPFYCGFTRSVVDQTLKGDLGFVDALLFGDHCVQVLGAADVVRSRMAPQRVQFHQLISSMSDAWSLSKARQTFAEMRDAIAELAGVAAISDEALHASIALFNRNRQLLRRLYDLRREGRCSLTAVQMQHLVKSSMVMDKAEHTEALAQLVALVEAGPARQDGGAVRLYLSGHLCQAPKLGVLALIESCGAVVVDDDLYHGSRYISTDVDETGDPLDALAHWYLQRNQRLPCPTRVDQEADWEGVLVDSVLRAGAQGMVVLMAKFCEPHMYYYPEIKAAFERHGIPHLLLETEHELTALEGLRTRVETFVEIVKRQSAAKEPA
jgi:benzoyl-CoA reductase subunit C